MSNALKNVFHDFHVIITFKMCRHHNLEFNSLAFTRVFSSRFWRQQTICFENKREKLDDEWGGHTRSTECILVIWLFAFGTPFLLSLWIEKNKRTDAKKSVITMSASGDDVEDSTEYSRYGIKDAPQTAIATPLGQVSARFLQNLQGVGLSFQIWTSARDRNVIYM